MEQKKITENEAREMMIENIAHLLGELPFTCDFVVKKNPKGIRILIEVTQEQMDEMTINARIR